MNLSLTNNDWGFIRTSIAIVCIIFSGYILLTTRSCQSDNGFRVEHSARMGGGGLVNVFHDTSSGDGVKNIWTMNGTSLKYLSEKYGITVDTTPKHTSYIQVKPIDLYFRKIDTLNIIVNNYLGKSLTVDQSDNLKQIFFRITNELKSDTTHAK